MLLNGKRRLPRDWGAQTQRDKQADEERFCLCPLESLVHYPKIMEELAELIGCKPNLLSLFFTDYKLGKRLWFGAHQPCTYRLRGPGATHQLAKTTINRLPVAWFTNARATGMAHKLLMANLLSLLGTP